MMPVADAEVFQVYWGRGVVGEPRPAYALRWTTSASDGSFAFDAAATSEPRVWVLETDAAEYGFFHAEFGLVRSGPAGGEGRALTLSSGRLDAAMRRASELALCGSRPPDAVVETLRPRVCERAPRSQK